MHSNYYPPTYQEIVFHCPHCYTKAKQHWHIITNNNDIFPLLKTLKEYKFHKSTTNIPTKDYTLDGQWEIEISICDCCKNFSIWINKNIIFPKTSNIESPNKDMPIEIKNLYNEAREIINLSPKSACALLRLALQKLMPHIGGEGKNIAKDINTLKENGKIDSTVYDALESLRLVGNNAVHPGKINIDDQPEYAQGLFSLLNYVIEELISRPNRAKKFRDSLPIKKQN